jgi:hypothetical protein
MVYRTENSMVVDLSMAIYVTNNQRVIYTSKEKSMGDLQDPIQWRYVNVPYVLPYFGGISPEI